MEVKVKFKKGTPVESRTCFNQVIPETEIGIIKETTAKDVATIWVHFPQFQKPCLVEKEYLIKVK